MQISRAFSFHSFYSRLNSNNNNNMSDKAREETSMDTVPLKCIDVLDGYAKRLAPEMGLILSKFGWNDSRKRMSINHSSDPSFDPEDYKFVVMPMGYFKKKFPDETFLGSRNLMVCLKAHGKLACPSAPVLLCVVCDRLFHSGMHGDGTMADARRSIPTMCYTCARFKVPSLISSIDKEDIVEHIKEYDEHVAEENKYEEDEKIE